MLVLYIIYIYIERERQGEEREEGGREEGERWRGERAG